MYALLEISLLELGRLAPEFALLFGVPDLRSLRRRTRLTVRGRGEDRIVVL